LCVFPVYAFDCLLSEGVNVISKIAYTLLKLWYNKKGSKFNSKCIEKFNDDVSDFCRNIIISPQDLL
uniref:Uncharacterized protein n=1 Tax=Romanomermis culicivorax TaxID=13658 RepID=A0A915ITS6_ROMCU